MRNSFRKNEELTSNLMICGAGDAALSLEAARSEHFENGVT